MKTAHIKYNQAYCQLIKKLEQAVNESGIKIENGRASIEVEHLRVEQALHRLIGNHSFNKHLCFDKVNQSA